MMTYLFAVFLGILAIVALMLLGLGLMFVFTLDTRKPLGRFKER